jgi:hypothetical protein
MVHLYRFVFVITIDMFMRGKIQKSQLSITLYPLGMKGS